MCTVIWWLHVHVALQWNKYVQCGRHVCSGAYANNVKCRLCSTYGHIVDCSDFTWHLYIDIVVSCLCSGETAWLLLRSPKTELFCVNKAILMRWSWNGWPLGGDFGEETGQWLMTSMKTEFFDLVESHPGDDLTVADQLVSGDTEGRESALFLLRCSYDRAVQVGRFLLWRWSWNACSSVTLGKRLCLFIVKVSWDTEHFELVELYSEDGLPMADHLVVTLRDRLSSCC